MDQGLGTNASIVARWVAGAPEPAILGAVKTRGKTQYEISTYRCPNCGYLESYASRQAS